MSVIDDINNTFAAQKAAGYPGSQQPQGGSTTVIGQFGRGNIDLYNRPQYKNPDGKISTVRSMSANIDGKEVLLPTVSRDANGNPILLSNEEAIQRYKDTGEHLGIFDSVDEANRYAEALHQQQEKYYSAQNKAAKPVTPAPAPQPQQLSFVDLYKKFNTYNPPTQEQVAEQERKQNRDTLFAKLGNGFNAFQQAYAAARGTKPLTQDTDYVGKTRDRYEKLTKERDALSREYANGMLRAAQADESLKQQAITNQLAQQRQERLERETRIKEEKASAYQQYQASVAAKNQEQAAYWHAKWQALESGKSADEALKEARAAQAWAAAKLANVRANNGGFASTANGGVGGYVVTEEKTDSRGRKTTSRKERRPTRGNQQQQPQQNKRQSETQL